jgi:hypothetical protein
MGYETNVKKRGLLDFDRTPSGVPKEQGSVHELKVGEQRALLADTANVLNHYSVALSEFVPQQSAEPNDNEYARIEQDVSRRAISDKATKFKTQATELYVATRGGNISQLSQLLIDQCHRLGELLGEPKAPHQEMAASWSMINEYIKSNRLEPVELQMRLLAIFDSPDLGPEYVREIEAEIRTLLNKLKKFSDKLAKMATLGEDTDDVQYHLGYKKVSKLLKDTLQSPKKAFLMAALKETAIKIKDLERNNNPVLLGLTDLEVVRYLTAESEATEAK